MHLFSKGFDQVGPQKLLKFFALQLGPYKTHLQTLYSLSLTIPGFKNISSTKLFPDTLKKT